MKKFSAFLSEAAKKSFASQDAEKLGLKHVGYGNYADPSGKVTHRSVDGRLVKMSPEEIKQQQGNGSGEDTGAAQAPQDAGSISITFGRFNPPTIGHETLVKRVAREAKGGEYRIYPSQSQDPKKNPLGFAEKVKYMKMAYPDHADAIQQTDARTIFDVLTSLNDEGYSEVKIIVGGDRVSEFNSIAQKYNGQLYEFENILVVSAGDRDPDADGVEGMSASKMRKAAVDNDYDSFKKGLPEGLDKEEAKTIYMRLRRAMNLESKDWKHAPELNEASLREAYRKGDLYNIGDVVENLNTGVIGRIVTRGTNYVIIIDEEKRVFRNWIRDIMETQWEVGTDEYRAAIQALTPGETVRSFTKKSTPLNSKKPSKKDGLK